MNIKALPVIKRSANRAILITTNESSTMDSDSKILLIRIRGSESGGGWEGWITPGGGIEENETDSEALKREVFEEVGYLIQSTPMHLWNREHEFEWDDKWIVQSEKYFLVPCKEFEVKESKSLTESEKKYFRGIKWFTLNEISMSREIFVPRNLAELLKGLIDNPGPAVVFQVGE